MKNAKHIHQKFNICKQYLLDTKDKEKHLYLQVIYLYVNYFSSFY
jgi:hypothetical protein